MPPDFSSRFQLAGQLLSQRKFEQARQIFLKILQQAPGHPDASNGMAIVLEGLGQIDQALYHAQRAAAGRPTDGAVLLRVLLGVQRDQRVRAHPAGEAVREVARRRAEDAVATDSNAA